MIEFKEPKLWQHQQQAFNMAKNRNHFAFLFDCGLGKTLACIKTLRYIYTQHQQLLPTLILAPIIVLENWKDEFLKFSKIPENLIFILN